LRHVEVIHLQEEASDRRFIADPVQLLVDQDQHGQDHGHVQDDAYPVHAGRDEVLEVQLLLDEPEEHLDVPSFPVDGDDRFRIILHHVGQEPEGVALIILRLQQPEHVRTLMMPIEEGYLLIGSNR